MDFLLILCRTLNGLKKKEKKKRPQLGVCSVFLVLKANAPGFTWDCSLYQWRSCPTKSTHNLFLGSILAYSPDAVLLLCLLVVLWLWHSCGFSQAGFTCPGFDHLLVFQTPVTLRWRHLPFLCEVFLWQKHLLEGSQGSTCPCWCHLISEASFQRAIRLNDMFIVNIFTWCPTKGWLQSGWDHVPDVILLEGGYSNDTLHSTLQRSQRVHKTCCRQKAHSRR